MASLTRNPKVRDDLVIIRRVLRGEVTYACKIPDPTTYQFLSELQRDLMNVIDGTRSREEIVETFNAEHPGNPIDLDTLEESLEDLRKGELLVKSREEKRLQICQSLKDRRRNRASSKSRYGNIFHLMLPAWNPEKYFDWIIPRIRFFWTRGFIILSGILIAVMLGIWVHEWEEIWADTIALFTFDGMTAVDLVEFLIVLFIVGFLHESAHGLTCRYFGGSVTQMGFMLLYFTPCFYVDVSDTYLFDKHYKTQWVVFAGCYIELVVCSLTTFVWLLTADATFVNDIAYKFMLMTGISSLVMNMDPLIKLDGYYALITYLEMPDLWERSFEYQGKWIQKKIFRLPVELEPVGRRMKKILLTYSSLSVVYKIVLITFFLLFMRNVFVSQFGGVTGYLVMALAILLMFRKYILKMYSFLKFNLLDKREVLMSRRSLTIAGAASVILLAATMIPRLPISIYGDFVLEPRSVAIVRASEGGIVERILVTERQQVAAGEALAVLRNEEIESDLRSRRIRADLVAHEIAVAAKANDRTSLAKKEREKEKLRDEIRILDQRRSELTLRSPIEGIVTTGRLEERAGSFIDVGGFFCEVTGEDGLIARVPIRESRLDEVETGRPVDLLLASYPYTELRGEVIFRAPASRDRRAGFEAVSEGYGVPTTNGASATNDDAVPRHERFEVIVGLIGDGSRFMAGMSGTARIHLKPVTVGKRTARAFRRWFRSRVW